MAKRQRKKKQNITLDDLKQESKAHKRESNVSNIVEKEKEKNVTLDDIDKDLSKDEKLSDNFVEEKIGNEEIKMNNEDEVSNKDEGHEEDSIFHRDSNTKLDDLEKINNEEGKINDEDDVSNKDEGHEENSIFHRNSNTTLDDLEKINNEEGKINNEDDKKEKSGPQSQEETGEGTNEDVKDIKDEEEVGQDTELNTNNEEISNEELKLDNKENIEKGGAENEEPVNTENNIPENGIENDAPKDNVEISDQNSDNSSDTEAPSKNSKEPSNGENDKGDIVLDHLGDHINSENMNVINVNDEKYNLSATSDTSVDNGEDTDSIVQDTQGGTDNENGEGDGEGVNLDEINISGIGDDENLQLDLSGGSLYDVKKAPRVRTGKITVLSVLITIISILIGALAYFYNDFITHDLTNIEENRAYTFVESAKDFISKYKKGEGTDQVQSINLIGKNGKTELDRLINGDLNYIQKKEILDDAVSNLSNNIISKYAKLNEIRNDITRYGFFPKDLSNIISESEPISSIQNSLVALEAIKFSSAISVFSYLDTFTTSLVQSLGIDRSEVEEKVGKVTSRGESDINIYIKNCYLNPFEGDYDCDYIGDFDEYYKKLSDDFDTEFFKELIKYTDSRLEQSEIPSFAISFKEFNQKDNEITFDIEINTLKEDEAELTKKGILSPHIFILNSLINSLRQSRFIVGDDISVKTLNVMPNTYIIGMSEINVNRSVNTFTVHIKKENAVEIDDFVYMDY